ncbi:hypothetical protein JHK84_055373 [Glycine max]|uniref:Uncharacterized protein n=1 Tax=Glycine max TaxID=3847 RepID=A0A0R0EJF3_SOYBN|nr:hypothetical protein JHK85_056347 [Glycine max]KAG5074142.1 hypothetical protein JHK84_055373 [Glycine max]KAH1034803.1 hypothetical protein GYH30_054974 [Glycine max]
MKKMNGLRRWGQGWIGGWIVKEEEEGREAVAGMLLAVTTTVKSNGGTGEKREKKIVREKERRENDVALMVLKSLELDCQNLGCLNSEGDDSSSPSGLAGC